MPIHNGPGDPYAQNPPPLPVQPHAQRVPSSPEGQATGGGAADNTNTSTANTGEA
jgi:hypothetical protein